MFGGHYTAFAECEDLLLPDANSHHHLNTQGLQVLLQEYLTYLPGGLGGVDSTGSASNDRGQGQQLGQQQRWFKFDDEFVLELPNQGYANGLPIDATIVSGKLLLLIALCSCYHDYAFYRVGVFVVLSEEIAILREHAALSVIGEADREEERIVALT